MVRQGIRRTHTGCVTCKARRVKCDEARPHCIRCTSTGRKCDGYVPWVSKALTRIRPSLIPGAQGLDLRSLDFYRHAVAPVLAGPLPRSFWTHVIPQVTHQEAAIRHATVAMSSLYEQFKEDSTLETPSRKFAVQHYNAAMKQVMCSTNTNLDTVVIACILFMSIEFLRGNVAGALLHHRHGKKILGSYNSDPQLLGIFRQLNVFFLFFSEFSDLSTLSVVGGPPVAGPFHHIGQAREALDWLTYRSMKVAFTIDQGTSGDCPPSVLSSFQTSKHSLDQELYGWLNAFTALQASTAPEQEVAYRLLEARWLICRIWSDTGLFQSPVHNAHDGSFQRIMDLVSVVSGVESKDSAEFIMGFGFPSILHFMVMRSRNLDFRLAALDMFRGKCCCSSEVFWDSKMLYLTAKKAIEEEHGIILESDWAEESESGRLIGSKNFRQPMFSRAQFLCPWVVVVMDVCDRIQQGT